MDNKKYQKAKKRLGKSFETELKQNATPAERKFKKLISQIKRAYRLRFKMLFQKGWYQDEAFFISDFYFPGTQMTVELDGASHEAKKQQIQDVLKEKYLASIGIKTVRIQNEKIYRMDCDKLFDYLVNKGCI